MAANKLHGTVEEQAAQLYDMAIAAMEEGRYSAAYRYFREIERAVPGFRDVPERIAQTGSAKREQRYLAMGSMVGAIVMIVAARLFNAQSELIFLGGAILGLLLGFIVSLVTYPLISRRSKPPANGNDQG